MDGLFDIVYRFLKWLSEISGFTYREINILVYFYIAPFFFLYLLERITKRHYLKLAFILIAIISFLVISDFEQFSHEVFDACVVFLESFDFMGWNYVEASVIFCVFVPLILVAVLIYFGRKKSPTS